MPEIAIEGDLVGPGVWVIGGGGRAEWIFKWLKSTLVSHCIVVTSVHHSNKNKNNSTINQQ